MLLKLTRFDLGSHQNHWLLICAKYSFFNGNILWINLTEKSITLIKITFDCFSTLAVWILVSYFEAILKFYVINTIQQTELSNSYRNIKLSMFSRNIVPLKFLKIVFHSGESIIFCSIFAWGHFHKLINTHKKPDQNNYYKSQQISMFYHVLWKD